MIEKSSRDVILALTMFGLLSCQDLKKTDDDSPVGAQMNLTFPLKELTLKHGEMRLLDAFMFRTATSGFLKSELNEEMSICENWEAYFEHRTINANALLLARLDSLLTSQGKDQRIAVLDSVSRWCNLTQVVFGELLVNELAVEQAMEVLYSIPETHVLFDSLIDPTTGQYTGSLSNSETCVISYRLIKYLEQQPEAKQIRLIGAIYMESGRLLENYQP